MSSNTTRRPPARPRAPHANHVATIPRTIVALKIASAVQEELGIRGTAEVAAAAAHPLRPESVAVLESWGRSAREWPSVDTWQTVAWILRHYDVVPLEESLEES